MAKSFKTALALGSAITNPAEALIRGSAQEAPKAPQEAAESITLTGEVSKKESKSRRLQSLLKPSLYDYLKRSADSLGISVNDRLNNIIEADRAREEGK